MRRIADGRAAVDASVSKAGSGGDVLRGVLEGPRKAIDGNVDALLALVDGGLVRQSAAGASLGQIFEAGTLAVNSSYALVDVSAREFDKYLARRIERLESEDCRSRCDRGRSAACGYLFMGFRRTMLAGIEEIQSGLGRMGNGVLNVPLAVTSRDAFGEVALALNEMQTSLRTRMDRAGSCRHNLRIRNALDKASTTSCWPMLMVGSSIAMSPFLNADGGRVIFAKISRLCGPWVDWREFRHLSQESGPPAQPAGCFAW
jgi:predicted HTH domain antitoxin